MHWIGIELDGPAPLGDHPLRLLARLGRQFVGDVDARGGAVRRVGSPLVPHSHQQEQQQAGGGPRHQRGQRRGERHGIGRFDVRAPWN